VCGWWRERTPQPDDVDAKLTVAGMPGKAASTEVAVADGVIDLLDWWAPCDGRAGPDDVERLAPLVVDDVLREEWVAAVVATCDPTWDDGLRPAPTDLPMRVGGWRIDLARAGVRSGFMATVLAGVLVQQGLTQMIIGVVAAVIPSVLDIDRVALSAGDRMLLVELRLHPEVRDRALDEDELYVRLPADVAAKVNRFEFADFVERLREAGYATEGATTRLQDPDGPPVRFSWR
jgi:hypothetical protein